MQDVDRIPELALAWLEQGRNIALATVIETWGSAPRGIGAQMVVDADAAFDGSVSGGCVEGAVVLEAQEAISDRRARVLEYGVSDDSAFAVGLACGGQIRVLVEPVGPDGLPEDTLRALVAARAERRPVTYSFDLFSGARRLEDGVDARTGIDGALFRHRHQPALRLIVVGAVHAAQPLLAFARALGHECILIDPRAAFANAERFPSADIRCDLPGEVLAGMTLDSSTAVVTLAHDPKIDDPALEAAIQAPVLYIGALGSRRTHAKRLDRLMTRGYSEAQLARIHGPVGLDIGALGPAEIALSILAELTAVLRGKAAVR